jgi:hypothetical protein
MKHSRHDAGVVRRPDGTFTVVTADQISAALGALSTVRTWPLIHGVWQGKRGMRMPSYFWSWTKCCNTARAESAEYWQSLAKKVLRD